MSGFVLNYENLKRWAARLFSPSKFPFDDEAEELALPHTLLEKTAYLVLIPRPERGMVTIAVTLPFSVPKERFAAVGEALTLLNARSYMGAWILNANKGEVYFRISVPALDVLYTDQALRFVVSIVASSAETMAGPLRAVGLEGAPPDTITSAAPAGTAP